MTGPKKKHTEADINELHYSHGSHVVGYCESKSLHADTQLWKLLFEQSGITVVCNSWRSQEFEWCVFD
jgi:hypothetical protein